MPNVLFKKLHPDVSLPQYETEDAAGLDIRARPDFSVVLWPGYIRMIPTGLSMQLPIGHEAQIRPRSGMAAKHGITVLNSPGTIDSDFRGEVGVILINHGPEAFRVQGGERIAQMVIAPVTRVTVEEAEVLTETARGVGGFGSTGTK